MEREKTIHEFAVNLDRVKLHAIGLHYRTVDGVEVELQHGPPRREFRFCCMIRWIFRLMVMAVVGKLVNRYLESRHPQPRPQR